MLRSGADTLERQGIQETDDMGHSSKMPRKHVPARLDETLYPYEAKVLELLRAGPSDRQAMAAALGTTPGTIGTAVWSLRRRGYRIVSQFTLTLKKEPDYPWAQRDRVC